MSEYVKVFATLDDIASKGIGDAMTTGTLDQFADVTQTAAKTLAITESTTLAGGTHSGTNTGDQTISDATISTTDITTNDVSISKHGFAPKAPNDTAKFLRGDGTWATTPGGSEAFPVGSVFIGVVSTSPATLLGYGTWSAFGAGRVLIGRDAGDIDFDTAEETGGAKTVASAGSNAAEAAHTHSVTSNVAIGNEAAHTHNYTQVIDHVHVIAAGQGSHQHDMAEGTADGSGTFMDRSNAAAATTAVTDLATLPAMGTNNPTGSVGATGATAAGSSHTHTPTNNAVTSGAGSSHNHAFTGSATSVVQPYIVVYMWKRTA